jgi:zinc D-Ala-D-Ala carboxypeptidase
MLTHFKESEFDCKHTGRNDMSPEFLERIDRLRGACGFPFTITSGYRDASHPEESHKAKGGTHTQGIAADVQITNGADRYTIVQTALQLGFTGIGVAKTFVHVDLRETTPVLWTY